ncbi:MAG TPA: cyclase family protein [Opitutales bacterium]|nr:cyclase family protein [Opitutales bacterium]
MTRRIIDLSHPLFSGSPSWPGDPGLTFSPHCVFEKHGCRVTRIETGTHQGTHVDAPSHFLAEGVGVGEMPLDPFIGPASLLHIPRGRGGIITANDLRAHADRIVPGARILLHTGWDAMWNHDGFFLDGPAIASDAAEYLAERHIALLGIDMATPSPKDPEGIHNILLGADVVIVETLANLGECPDSFTFIALPLALSGLDGSPVRAVAVVD